MKKVFALSAFAFLMLAVSFQAQAIEDPNPKGTTVIGVRAGYYPGFGANVVGDYTLVDSWWKGHFTVGGYLGFNSRTYGYETYHWTYSNFAVMPRVTYGLNITKEFEVHAGVMAGLCLTHWPSDYYGENNQLHFIHGELVGARYMFTPKFGVEAELIYTGYMSYFNAGVTFKL